MIKNDSLNQFIYKVNQPCLFKNILIKSEQINSACDWNIEKLISIFKDEKLEFRIDKIQFENKCDYISATLSQFNEWISPNEQNDNEKKRKFDKTKLNPFDEYNLNEYWAYADYKYMNSLTDKDKGIINENCINWSNFGFSKRNANDSTLWIGSQGAFTPCHFDTYGYNLVAQIYGKKRWIMFSKNDSNFMYPTRVPFEESTVYSRVNIKYPNLEEFSMYKNVTPYVVELEPGDVLYVPSNWWHYVESLTESISINTWVELESEDDMTRLKEIISKTVLQGLMESNFISFENWLNSSENYMSQDDNMKLIEECLNKLKKSQEKSDSKIESNNELIDLKEQIKANKFFSRFIEPLSFKYYLENYTKQIVESNDLSNDQTNDNDLTELILNLSNSITNPNVINLITKNFLENSKKASCI